MRLVRLVVAGLALGAAIGFVGAFLRPRSVRGSTSAEPPGASAVLPPSEYALTGSAGTC
jgi:hypothetical protein